MSAGWYAGDGGAHRRAAVGAAVAVALTAVLAQGTVAAPGAHAVPPDRPVAELLGELRSRYRAAGAATEAYNAAQERLRAHRSKVARLGKELRDSRAELTARRVDAGRLARAQYRDRTAGLTPYVRMALSDDPQRVLEQRHLLRRAARGQALALSRLKGGEQRLARSTARARQALATQRALAAEQKSRRDTVRKRLDSIAELLGSLSTTERAEVRRREQAEVRAERQESPAGGPQPLPEGTTEGGDADYSGPVPGSPRPGDGVARPQPSAGSAAAATSAR